MNKDSSLLLFECGNRFMQHYFWSFAAGWNHEVVSGKMAKNLIDLGDCEGAHEMENPEEILEPKELEVSQTIASE